MKENVSNVIISVRGCNRRGFWILERIFILFVTRYTKRDAGKAGAVSEVSKK